MRVCTNIHLTSLTENTSSLSARSFSPFIPNLYPQEKVSINKFETNVTEMGRSYIRPHCTKGRATEEALGESEKEAFTLSELGQLWVGGKKMNCSDLTDILTRHYFSLLTACLYIKLLSEWTTLFFFNCSTSCISSPLCNNTTYSPA